MASKTNIRKSSKSSAFLSKHWWKIGILILFIASTSFIGYNKYLDQQNVNNMKQLLADFEQLKIDAEKETGEDLTIKTDCQFAGEKFNQNYFCNIYLLPLDTKSYNKTLYDSVELKFPNIDCSVSKGGIYEGFKFCRFGEVRSGSSESIKNIIGL